MADGMIDEGLTTQEQREHLMEAERKGRKTVERLGSRLESLEIEHVTLDQLSPNPWNPNRQSDHDFELLLRSMEEDGFTTPVIVARLDEDHLAADERMRNAGLAPGALMIVDGEHRWRAAHRLGYETIPIVVVPQSIAQMRVATLRHNRARGSEDIELAADVLRDLQALGSLDIAQDSLMLDDVELQRMIEDVAAPEILAGEQFADAWVPDRGADGRGESPTVALTEGTGGQGAVWGNAATNAAVEASRRREEQLAAARSEEQRAMIRKDTARDYFRLSLIFAGEEAEIVKAVLGGAPAEAVLDLCRKEKGETDRQLGEGWVTVDSLIGSRAIPGPAAQILSDALDRMEQAGDLGKKNRWQGLEYLAAEYLGGHDNGEPEHNPLLPGPRPE